MRDWVRVSHSTWHKISYFGDVSDYWCCSIERVEIIPPSDFWVYRCCFNKLVHPSIYSLFSGAAEPDSGRAPADSRWTAEPAWRCWAGNRSTAHVTCCCCCKQHNCCCPTVSRPPRCDCRPSRWSPSWTQGRRATVRRGLKPCIISLSIILRVQFYVTEL